MLRWWFFERTCRAGFRLQQADVGLRVRVNLGIMVSLMEGTLGK
jgi:hypothetical protein